jgi:hypothetical protein
MCINITTCDLESLPLLGSHEARSTSLGGGANLHLHHGRIFVSIFSIRILQRRPNEIFCAEKAENLKNKPLTRRFFFLQKYCFLVELDFFKIQLW